MNEEKAYLKAIKGNQDIFIITQKEFAEELTLLLLFKGWGISLTYMPESEAEVTHETNAYDLTGEKEKDVFVKEVNTFGGPIVSNLKYDINLN